MEQETKQKASFAELANKFIGGRSIHHYQGRTLLYDRTRYVEETALPTKVRRWLIENDQPHNNHTVSNVVGAIQAITFIDSLKYPSMPFHFGSGEFPRSVIAYRNGLLDVDGYCAGRRELMPHTADWVSAVCLPFDFDPSAQCPQYDAFLDWAMGKDYQQLWDEWGGYCLTADTSLQRFLLKFGPTGSGKGTTDSVLQAVLGDGNWSGFNLTSLVNNPRFALAPIAGKLAAFVGETELPKHGKPIIVERLKSITGGDAQEIEYKGINERPSIVLTARLNISCNSMPTFIDTTAALRRRMLLIRFLRSIPDDQRDGELFKKLATELAGINNRFLNGLARLRQQGRFSEPADMQQRIGEFVRQSSPALRFIQDCLIVERRLDTGNLPAVDFVDEPLVCNTGELQAVWAGWHPSNDPDGNFHWLMRHLGDLLPDLKSQQKRNGTEWHREYQGIVVRQAPEMPTMPDLLSACVGISFIPGSRRLNESC
jgi:putative DNA primase/helicase